MAHRMPSSWKESMWLEHSAVLHTAGLCTRVNSSCFTKPFKIPWHSELSLIISYCHLLALFLRSSIISSILLLYTLMWKSNYSLWPTFVFSRNRNFFFSPQLSFHSLLTSDESNLSSPEIWSQEHSSRVSPCWRRLPLVKIFTSSDFSKTQFVCFFPNSVSPEWLLSSSFSPWSRFIHGLILQHTWNSLQHAWLAQFTSLLNRN